MLEEIKTHMGIDELPEGVDTNRLEELWSDEETKVFALRLVNYHLNS